VWYKIYDRSFRYGREESLLEVLPPLDWDKVGQDSWRDIFRNISKLGWRKTAKGLLSRSKKVRASTWDGIFRPVRQPDWWQGDAKYHPPAYSEPASELEQRLIAGEFVVTCELTPPLSSYAEKLIESIEKVKPFVTMPQPRPACPLPLAARLPSSMEASRCCRSQPVTGHARTCKVR
jgi:hypothetical protein